MKAKLFTIALLITISGLYKHAAGQANTTLSNLVAPTAVNRDLLPTPSNGLNLGSGAQNWKNIYIGTSYYLKNLRIIHSLGATNFFVGPAAGNATLTGTNNTSMGDNVLALLTTGSFNTGVGFTALRNATTGSRNAALGYVTLYNNTSGSYNAVLGERALFTNTTGSYNTVSGSTAMLFNTSGTNNSTYGYAALYKNTTGTHNVAVGNEALHENTTGDHNVALGTGAMYSNITANNQVAIGDNALYHLNGGGGNNVATGSEAMYATTTGNYNTAAGNESMLNNTTGSFNVAMGYNALGYATTSTNTASIGAHSMFSNGGSYNAVLGAYAGYYLSTNSTFLGWFARGGAGGVTNSIAIGYNTVASGNNQVRIGNASVTSIGGPVGWSVISDGRFKKEVKEDVPGLSFINQLRPVTYHFDPAAFNTMIENTSPRKMNGNDADLLPDERNAVAEKSNITYTGFIAQEVDAVAKKMKYDFSGIDAPKNDKDYYGLRYSDFVVPMVKGMQELSKQNDSLKTENEKLKAEIILFEERLKKIESLLKIKTSPVLSLSGASLEQNTPNPFKGNTIVNYKVAQGVTNAQIAVYDAAGKKLKLYSIPPNENGTLHIDAATLPAGTYHYTLFVNGNIIDTKKMILVK